MEHFFELMKSEWERLMTFNVRPSNKWPLSFITPESLAESGFFYLLSSDRCQCAFCRGIVCGWEIGDRPLNEHAKHFPNCPFICRNDVGNIPIGDDPILGVKPGTDVCGNRTEEQMNQLYSTGINVKSDTKTLNMREFGVQPHHGPKNPNYTTPESREQSFGHCWDPTTPVSTHKLAESGFFSIGMSDYVKCFYCDGGLCNWESGDDPWTEHAKWFGDCDFLRLNVGDDFVNRIQTQKQNEELSNVMSLLPHANGEVASNLPNEDSVVKEWMKSDIVMQLIDMQTYPLNTIRDALTKRWITAQQPFESFDKLYDFVASQNSSQCSGSSQSNEQSLETSDDENVSSLSPQSSSPPESSSPLSSGSSLEFYEPKHDTNRLLCKICLDREIGVVFLPCGHQLSCTQCAPCLSDCPICRKPIRGTVRTFFS